jgi:hypothetical protein
MQLPLASSWRRLLNLDSSPSCKVKRMEASQATQSNCQTALVACTLSRQLADYHAGHVGKQHMTEALVMVSYRLLDKQAGHVTHVHTCICAHLCDQVVADV